VTAQAIILLHPPLLWYPC